MRSPLHFLSILAAAAAVSLSAVAAPSTPHPKSQFIDNGENADENDAETRANPKMDDEPSDAYNAPRRYSFINTDANRIIMNGHSWENLTRKFDMAADGRATVSVVHIGDSHLQPDGSSGRVRRYLQKAYGNAGRGLMIPYRVAGTNQPLDYRISTSSPVTSAKLMRMPWPTMMGFTGIAVHPDVSSPSFSLKGPEPFRELRVYADREVELSSATANGQKVQFIWHPMHWGGIAVFPHPVNDLSLSFNSRGATFYGFDSRRLPSANISAESEDDASEVRNPGVVYHSIGNNGAAYSSYSSIGNYGEKIAPLKPDLAIIALGTNEAFGRTSDAAMYSQIDRLVSEVRRENPGCEILLVTPSECQRSVYTTKRTGRRRRRTSRIRSYAVNENVARMRNIILRYGREKSVPVYDFYEVAGGKGSSAKWLSNRLLSSDRIHRTWNGYYLEGDLLYAAIANALGQSELRLPSLAPTPVVDRAKVKPSTRRLKSSKYKSKKSSRKASRSSKPRKSSRR